MFDIVLYQPEIPPNTGNLIRLAANTGCRLHLVEPLGFDLSDKQVARAGLDYHDMACVQVHADWAAVQTALSGRRWFALTTKGRAHYADAVFQAGDVFVFGPESRGLPPEVLDGFDAAHRLRLPMLPDSRSMNLSNAVSVVVFEAWRQNGFAGGG
ncbi:MAG: tRNA (uridine(34)/cytosine(34)/5-carboxymethylaminomethyluridine(34)-2'-O)-methyltransferase TrmL [Hydrogenophilales bacterium RIFOXYD1_FULL_62_11]|nr:MAG: tRNA (uridine(34)/cytosine(34)/5-carboxymethylaminomethyluridine(34)-2'-O)-methyltransferase TrmL [Hydrogenophilales bacterium RIFOXYD1_FULL_62_11]